MVKAFPRIVGPTAVSWLLPNDSVHCCSRKKAKKKFWMYQASHSDKPDSPSGPFLKRSKPYHTF